jgi:hypothetical protein
VITAGSFSTLFVLAKDTVLLVAQRIRRKGCGNYEETSERKQSGLVCFGRDNIFHAHGSYMELDEPDGLSQPEVYLPVLQLLQE